MDPWGGVVRSTVVAGGVGWGSWDGWCCFHVFHPKCPETDSKLLVNYNWTG